MTKDNIQCIKGNKTKTNKKITSISDSKQLFLLWGKFNMTGHDIWPNPTSQVNQRIEAEQQKKSHLLKIRKKIIKL